VDAAKADGGQGKRLPVLSDCTDLMRCGASGVTPGISGPEAGYWMWSGMVTEHGLQPMILLDIPGPTVVAFTTRAQRLAHWINAYNTLVARGILALEIRRSIWDVPDFFDRIRLRAGTLVFSLNEIEHGLLRGNRPHPLSTGVPFPIGDPRLAHAIAPLEPRIHFAISCGARSCPQFQTYDPAGLDEQLDEATRAFVNREVVLEGQTVTASPIFHWFRADFEEAPGGLAGFLVRYLEDGPTRRAIVGRGLGNIAWRPYDWSVAPPGQALGSQEGGWIAPA